MFAQKLARVEGIEFSYDYLHDVLYIYFGEPRPSFSEEIAPGFFISLSEDDETLTGIIIIDYKKRDKDFLAAKAPISIDFDRINAMLH
ncbi:MAG TPA: DUF2283 domain-containing protein [Clostridia bacterium]|nr:DUF2283 domain-containing protein [Clostridia bacterium]